MSKLLRIAALIVGVLFLALGGCSAIKYSRSIRDYWEALSMLALGAAFVFFARNGRLSRAYRNESSGD